MDRATVETYEHRSDEWIAARSPKRLPEAEAFGRTIAADWPSGSSTSSGPGGWRADLGCGPGWYTEALGAPTIALDATQAMLDVVPRYAPNACRLRADLEALPIRRGALAAAWANASYVHVPAERVPLALADLHRAVRVGGAVQVNVIADRDS
ncbi:MAG: double-stranded uracil-DNA glycosylase, partial [Actinomycetota bacterium]|nr:double-stranded uracil-DNA glycosylase [Actinomycetota bacterium]